MLCVDFSPIFVKNRFTRAIPLKNSKKNYSNGSFNLVIIRVQREFYKYA